MRKTISHPFAHAPRRWRTAFWTLHIGALAAIAAILLPRYVEFIGREVATGDVTVYEWQFNRRGPEIPIPQVVIVEINKSTIQNLGNVWPIPHSYYTRLLGDLKRYGARIVGLDIVFGSDSDPRVDQQFARAMAASGNVILAADFSSITGANQGQADIVSSGQDFPLPIFRDGAAAYAPANVPPDSDNSIRDFQPTMLHLAADGSGQEQTFPTFAVEVAGQYLGLSQDALVKGLQHLKFAGHEMPTSDDPWRMSPDVPLVRICFAGYPRQSCSYIGFDQVLSAEDHPEEQAALRQLFQGKIVLLGNTDEAGHDTFQTPLRTSTDVSRPGVEVQANIIHTLLASHYYRSFPELARIALILLAALGTAMITLGLRPARALLVLIPMLAICMMLDALLFRHHVFMRPTQILAAILLANVGETIFLYLTEENRAKEARRHFGRYVGPRVLEKVLDQGHIELSGEIRHVAIMFTDVQGFTSLSEKMAPQEAVSVLNRYLNLMVNCIFRHEGTLDKVMGDGIMAYFGAPNDVANPELNAVECAIEMQQLMRRWREDCAQQGLPPLHKRIGIHAGQVIVGEVGSANQVGYTVIGDNVNVAARLEPLNKEKHTDILISEEVCSKLPDSIIVVPQGEVPIRGRKEPIRAFSVEIPPVGAEPAPAAP